MTEPVAPATPEPAADAPATPDWEAEAKKWKETSLKIEARANTAAAEAKANAEAARKLKEIEDRELPELQRLQRDRDELSQRLTPLEQENARLRVAVDKGIPKALIGRLQGSTVEELTADADELLTLLNVPAAAAVAPVNPRPDASQGAQPVSAEAQLDAEYATYLANAQPTRRR